MVHEYANAGSAVRQFHANGQGILRYVAGKWLVFDSVEDARGHPTTETKYLSSRLEGVS